MPALNIILALLAGILLIGDSDSLAAADQSPPFAADVAEGSHEHHVDSVRHSNQREYARVLALYDAHLRDQQGTSWRPWKSVGSLNDLRLPRTNR